MLGLAAIGTALILGIGMRMATGAGALLMVLMWSAVLPPAGNPSWTITSSTPCSS
jgi:thiosulfate dehydrogenase [quinone] large subunit